MCKFRAFENERETARGRRTDYDMVTVTRVENSKTVEIQARPYGDTRGRFIESDNESDSSNDIESPSPPAVTNGLRYRSSSIARAPSIELELKADDEDTTTEERPLRSAPHASTARAESPPPPGSPPGRPVSPPSWRETPGLQHEFDDAEGDDDDGDE